ncbi:hypothetical protein LXL04_020946 [Taraxacum kok-saghyz]
MKKKTVQPICPWKIPKSRRLHPMKQRSSQTTATRDGSYILENLCEEPVTRSWNIKNLRKYNM